MELRGIDVSKHQGVIDWPKVKVDFAIIRLGYSAYPSGGVIEDELFQYNSKMCDKYGIPWGVYVYSYDRTPEAAAKTAEETVALLAGRKPSYPVYYDIEENTCDARRHTAMCNAFCEYIKHAGYLPGVYSYYYFFRNNLSMSELYPAEKWIADYRGKRPGDIAHEIWQYSGTGRVEGIDTIVDLNVCYKDYTREEKEDSELATLIKELKEVLKRYDND